MMSSLRGERGERERERASELVLTAFLSLPPPRCQQLGLPFSMEYLYFVVINVGIK